MLQSTGISGPNLLLRAIDRDDLKVLRSYINDPGVETSTNTYRPITEFQQEQWYQHVSTAGNCEWFAIVDTRSRSRWVIGTCGIENIDWISRVGELRCRIGRRQAWGGGLGTETMGLLIRHAFVDLNLERVWGRVYASNQRALRMDLRAGLRIEGRLRGAAYVAGSREDVLMVGLLRSRWRRGGGGLTPRKP